MPDTPECAAISDIAIAAMADRSRGAELAAKYAKRGIGKVEIDSWRKNAPIPRTINTGAQPVSASPAPKRRLAEVKKPPPKVRLSNVVLDDGKTPVIDIDKMASSRSFTIDPSWIHADERADSVANAIMDLPCRYNTEPDLEICQRHWWTAHECVNVYKTKDGKMYYRKFTYMYNEIVHVYPGQTEIDGSELKYITFETRYDIPDGWKLVEMHVYRGRIVRGIYVSSTGRYYAKNLIRLS